MNEWEELNARLSLLFEVWRGALWRALHRAMTQRTRRRDDARR